MPLTVGPLTVEVPEPSAGHAADDHAAWYAHAGERLATEHFLVGPGATGAFGLNAANAVMLGYAATRWDDDRHANDGEAVYGIGDSAQVALAKPTNNLAPDGEDSYVNQLARLADVDADHGMAGRGKGTIWALQHWAQYLAPANKPDNDVFLIGLGSIDYRMHNGGLSPQQTADNLLSLYTLFSNAQPETLFVIMEPTPKNPEYERNGNTAWEDHALSEEQQRLLMGAVRDMCERNHIPCFTTWDVWDAVPGNGVYDGYSAENQDAYDTRGHPDVDGHARVAAALYEQMPELAATAGLPAPWATS